MPPTSPGKLHSTPRTAKSFALSAQRTGCVPEGCSQQCHGAAHTQQKRPGTWDSRRSPVGTHFCRNTASACILLSPPALLPSPLGLLAHPCRKTSAHRTGTESSPATAAHPSRKPQGARPCAGALPCLAAPADDTAGTSWALPPKSAAPSPQGSLESCITVTFSEKSVPKFGLPTLKHVPCKLFGSA